MSRTKSPQAHSKVLEAALVLFAEHGIDRASMDAIAELSGVSKATIYKHWQDKQALALEALGLLFGLHEVSPKFDSGELRRDLVDVLTYQPASERQAMKNRVMPHLMAYAARHPEFGKQWRSRVMGLPQARLKALMRRGMAEGRLGKRFDLQVGVGLLLGPMLYWQIFVGGKSGKTVPTEWAVQVVDAFWKAFSK